MWLLGTGMIQYDPPRPGLRKNTNWWCIVTIDPEITRYYRWWIQKTFHIKELKPPSWDAHISVIRGEKPTDDLLHLWKKYDNQSIEFKYEHYPKCASSYKTTGNYWYIDIECPTLTQIRQEFNKPSDWTLHLTVGRVWY